MNQKSLSVNALIETVLTELLRVKYKEQRISLYEYIWATLLRFREKRNLSQWIQNLGR